MSVVTPLSQLDYAVGVKIHDFLQKTEPPKGWDEKEARKFREQHLQRTGKAITAKNMSFPFYKFASDNTAILPDVNDKKLTDTGLTTLKEIFSKMIEEQVVTTRYESESANFVYSTETIENIPSLGNPFEKEQREVLTEIRQLYLQDLYSIKERRPPLPAMDKKRRRLEAYQPALRLFYENKQVPLFEKALEKRSNPDPLYQQLNVDRPKSPNALDDPSRVDKDIKEFVDNFVAALRVQYAEEKHCVEKCIEEEMCLWQRYFVTGRYKPVGMKYITNPAQIQLVDGKVSMNTMLDKNKMAIFKLKLWKQWQAFAKDTTRRYVKALSALQRVAKFEYGGNEEIESRPWGTQKGGGNTPQSNVSSLVPLVSSQGSRGSSVSSNESRASSVSSQRSSVRSNKGGDTGDDENESDYEEEETTPRIDKNQVEVKRKASVYDSDSSSDEVSPTPVGEKGFSSDSFESELLKALDTTDESSSDSDKDYKSSSPVTPKLDAPSSSTNSNMSEISVSSSDSDSAESDGTDSDAFDSQAEEDCKNDEDCLQKSGLREDAKEPVAEDAAETVAEDAAFGFIQQRIDALDDDEEYDVSDYIRKVPLLKEFLKDRKKLYPSREIKSKKEPTVTMMKLKKGIMVNDLIYRLRGDEDKNKLKARNDMIQNLLAASIDELQYEPGGERGGKRTVNKWAILRINIDNLRITGVDKLKKRFELTFAPGEENRKSGRTGVKAVEHLFQTSRVKLMQNPSNSKSTAITKQWYDLPIPGTCKGSRIACIKYQIAMTLLNLGGNYNTKQKDEKSLKANMKTYYTQSISGTINTNAEGALGITSLIFRRAWEILKSIETMTDDKLGKPIKEILDNIDPNFPPTASDQSPAIPSNAVSIEYDMDISDTEVAEIEQALQMYSGDLEKFDVPKPKRLRSNSVSSIESGSDVSEVNVNLTSYDSSSDASETKVNLTSYDSSSDGSTFNLKASAYDSTSDGGSSVMNLTSYDSGSDHGSETNLAYISSSSDSESDSGTRLRRSRRTRGKAPRVTYDSDFSETELNKLIYDSGSDTGRSDTNAPYHSHSESDSDLEGI